MNFVKINFRNQVELRNTLGILIRTITDRAQSANISQDGEFILVTKLNGQVELRKSSGILVRSISTGAKDAKFQGKDILVFKDRICELRNQSGTLLRRV